MHVNENNTCNAITDGGGSRDDVVGARRGDRCGVGVGELKWDMCTV